MKIDPCIPLRDLDGDPIVEQDEAGNSRPLTLGVVCARALVSALESDRSKSPLKPEEQIRRWNLACAFASRNPVELDDPKDLVLLRERLAAAFGALISGQACSMLWED